MTGPTTVIDNASYTCAAGCAGELSPSVVIPSVVGKPDSGVTNEEYYVGEEAQTMENLRLFHPIEQGLIANWNDMEKLWHHILFEKLNVSSENYSVLLTEPTRNPKMNREKTIQLMFETFSSGAAYLVPQEVVSLYASGRTDGIVFNCGDTVSLAVPVYEGYARERGKFHSFLAGRDVTDNLMKRLNERGYSLSSKSDYEQVRLIKEKCCYVTLNFEVEIKDEISKCSYTLPDGKNIIVGPERIQCPEVLFQPSLIDADSPGIAEFLSQAIAGCEPELQQVMYENILLSGGSTRFQGFAERMEKEISLQAPDKQVKIIDPPATKYSSWIGGSILAALPDFQKMWITKQEYDENGPGIVHKKCL